MAFLVTGWAYYSFWSMSRPPSTEKVKTYVCLIPLPERSGIDLDDCTLDECVCSDKLVVGSVVNLEDDWDRLVTDKTQD